MSHKYSSDKACIFVTGASGFVGLSVVSRLHHNHLPVVAVSRKPIPHLDPDIKHILLDHYSTLTAPTGSILVHLAEPPSSSIPSNLASRHHANMLDLVTVLLHQPWKHVVYASSSLVYGSHGLDSHKTNEYLSPTDSYAKSKLACEYAVLNAGGTVLRLSNVYGPGLSQGTIISDIFSQLTNTGPVFVRNSAPERDFLWLGDVSDGILASVQIQLGGLFNLASGTVVSVKDLAQIILNAAGQLTRPIVSRSTPTHSRISLDISDTILQLQWRPKVSLIDGIHRILPFSAL